MKGALGVRFGRIEKWEAPEMRGDHGCRESLAGLDEKIAAAAVDRGGEEWLPIIFFAAGAQSSSPSSVR
ncbi:MAG: hypothetical protein WB817_13690 [Terriglobales bacterium]